MHIIACHTPDAPDGEVYAVLYLPSDATRGISLNTSIMFIY
jgi:hypothetical protein